MSDRAPRPRKHRAGRRIALGALAAALVGVAVTGAMLLPTFQATPPTSVGTAAPVVPLRISKDLDTGQALPSPTGGSWARVFSDDFRVVAKAGQFPTAYRKRWLTYNGFADTSGDGRYDESTLSAADGVLRIALRREGSRAIGGGIVPLPDSRWGGQVHGRFSIRLKADAVPGFGLNFLLWSDDNTWSQGEVDYPEGPLTGGPSAANHCVGNPSKNCFFTPVKAKFSTWHTYTIEWTDDAISYLLDGKVVGRTTTHIPTAKLHAVLQVASTGDSAVTSKRGSVYVDWVAIDRYRG